MAVPAVPSTSPKTNAAAGAMASTGQLEPDEDRCRANSRCRLTPATNTRRPHRTAAEVAHALFAPGKRVWRSNGSSVVPRVDLRAAKCR
jgi:hypothetical protein